MAATVRLLAEPFDPSTLLATFTDAHPGAGGIASFTGLVRGDAEVEALELLHYDKLTLAGMEELAERTLARFELAGLLILHRHGSMSISEPIVLVAAAARHRRAAIEAVDFAMDHLKSDSWFWKREKRAGAWHWIEPREEDHADLARWSA